MKKNKRIGALIDELTGNPNKLYDSKHFCKKFDIAKSSLSEDIKMANEIFAENGSGHIESISGVGGGIKFVPGISMQDIIELQNTIIEKLSDPSRILGGGFLYTADIMYDSHFVRDMARIFADRFSSLNADYVVTVETKGIPLASQVAFMLNLPLVVIRREAMYSEGSTVSINYFSGSTQGIAKMSIAKRAVSSKTEAIVIDDFMKGGGSLRGVKDILAEFDIVVVGIGVALESRDPANKKVKNYSSILIIDDIDEENRKIKISRSLNL
ncbi:MAG: pur operon repressor [Clostridiales bacterium]|nr:pur operon repressor [Clostridiales bacterium]